MNRFKSTHFLTILFILAVGGAIIGGIAGGGSGVLIGASVGAVGGLITKKLVKGDEAEGKEGMQFGVYIGRSISLPKY